MGAKTYSQSRKLRSAWDNYTLTLICIVFEFWTHRDINRIHTRRNTRSTQPRIFKKKLTKNPMSYFIDSPQNFTLYLLTLKIIIKYDHKLYRCRVSRYEIKIRFTERVTRSRTFRNVDVKWYENCSNGAIYSARACDEDTKGATTRALHSALSPFLCTQQGCQPPHVQRLCRGRARAHVLRSYAETPGPLRWTSLKQPRAKHPFTLRLCVVADIRSSAAVHLYDTRTYHGALRTVGTYLMK